MKLIYPQDKSWVGKEGYSKKVLLDPKEIDAPGAQIQLIKIAPGEVAKLHHHKIQTEIFYFQEINGEFIVEGEKIDLKSGSILMIQPEDKHEVRNNTEKDFEYLVFKVNYKEDDLYWD